MSSRGSKKKNVTVKSHIQTAAREKERKNHNRRLWWQLHKKPIVIIICVVLALTGIIIGIAANSGNSDIGGTSGTYTLMDLGS